MSLRLHSYAERRGDAATAARVVQEGLQTSWEQIWCPALRRANGIMLASWGCVLRVDCRRTRYSHHIDTAATGTDTDLGGRRGRHHPNASSGDA